MSEQRIRTLLVEDNDDDIVFIREAFNSTSQIYIEQIAKDGDEALAYLHGVGAYRDMPTPDLVLLDLNIPKKNGFQILDAIKADARLQYIPVVVLTISTREDDIIHAYSKGAASYICKERNFSSFQKMIEIFDAYWTRVASLPVH